MSTGGTAGFPEGGFSRVRDNYYGYSAEINRQKQLDAERQRLKQAEQDRINRKQAIEDEKRRVLNEERAREAFRDFQDQRGDVVENVLKYTEARGYYRENYKLANAELLNPEFIKYFYPEKFAKLEHAKADAADLKPLYVAKCTSCRTPFLTDEKLAEHLRNTRPCPRCKSVCSSGGQVHICHAPCPHCVDGDTYNCIAFNQFHRLEEDRVPEVKYEESGEE